MRPPPSMLTLDPAAGRPARPRSFGEVWTAYKRMDPRRRLALWSIMTFTTLACWEIYAILEGRVNWLTGF